jgi:hypothetical protein
VKVQVTIAVIVVSAIVAAFWFWPVGDAFTNEYERVAGMVAEMVEQDPTSAGISKASSYFSSNNSIIKERLKAVLKNGSISASDRQRYQSVINKYSSRLGTVADKHPELKTQLSQLSADMGLQRLSY